MTRIDSAQKVGFNRGFWVDKPVQVHKYVTIANFAIELFPK